MSTPKVTCIIQARMGSSRLSGKVLKPLLGKPVLYWEMQRIKQCKLINKVVVATSLLERDNEIVSLCAENNWLYYRGSEDDVLDRYYQAARHFQAEILVRITSDCPLIDPDVTDQVISAFLHSNPQVDYMSNISPRTYPQGLDTEVFSFACLEKTWNSANDPASREHVTPYIYNNPSEFTLGFVTSDTDYSHEHWVLDTPSDFAFIENVYQHFGHANFRMSDVLQFVKRIKMIPKLFVRTDANSQIGGGHFMRCLALAHAWQNRGGEVMFISCIANPLLEKKLCDANIVLQHIKRPYPDDSDLQTTAALIQTYFKEHDTTEAWFVLDGYQFDSTYQAEVKKTGCKLLAIDDTAELPRYHADIILNQNINAKHLHYQQTSSCTFLLGLEYALMQPQFLKYKEQRNNTAAPVQAKNILVTMGAADSPNVTLKVLQALALLLHNDNTTKLEIKVVLGPLNPHHAALQHFLSAFPHPASLTVDADMPELMAWADMAISAAGSSCWELLFMGVPAIIIEVSDNQKGIAESIRTQGLGLSVGRYDQVTAEMLSGIIHTFINDPLTRELFSSRGKDLVDGRGAERVVEKMIEVTAAVALQ